MKDYITEARKFLTALATALSSLAVALDEGVTDSEWIMVALAFLGALGVYAVPNAARIRRDKRGRFAPLTADE